MHTGVIIVTNPGHVPTEGYIERALANNPTCAGFTLYDAANKKLLIQRQARPDLKSLMKVFDGCKAHRVNVWLGKAPDGYLAEDIQPFVLVEDANKNPLVACMLDGDWVTTATGDSNHSDEFHTATQQLKPVFNMLHRLTKGDVKAMIEEIEGEATTNTILNTFINRGNVHLMFNDGQVRTVEKNPLGREYDWGWTSNYYMFGEEQQPEPVVEAPKTDMLSSLLGAAALPAVDPMQVEPKVEPKVITPPPAKVEPPKDERKKGPNGKFFVGEMVSCPRETKAPNKIEGWYRHHAGHVPENYLQYPKVAVREKLATPVASQEEVKKLVEKFPGKATDTRILPDTHSSPAEVEKRAPPPVKHVPNIMPPIAPVEPVKQPDVKTHFMSVESQKGIVDKFLKETEKMVTTTDRSGNKITDPKDAPALESKATPFAERVGIQFEDTFSWTSERLEKLMYDYPDAFLHLYLDTRRMLAPLLKTASVIAEPTKITPPKLGIRKTG